jgi:hypothetical protein
MRLARRQLVLLAALAIAGCTAPLHKGKSPLMPTQMTPDSVALDIFFVRYPFGDSTVNEKLWEEIDEQHFAPELRERLAGSGFRIGLVSGQMPMELSKLLQLGDKPAPGDTAAETKVSDLEAQPRVMRQHLQLRTGLPSKIVVSGIYAEWPVLRCEGGQLCGQTYNQAQGIFTVKSFPQPDGWVRLELTPELDHDQPQQRWIESQGMAQLAADRPKRVFDDLKLSADLAPGAMLVLGSLPNQPGSLGHYFLTEKEEHLEQKLLIVRLSQTQHDGLFNPPEPLKLDE